MGQNIEIERTFLAKYLPEGLKLANNKKIIDIYLPSSSPHAKLRLRSNGEAYVITKKSLINSNDPSQQTEDNIKLTEAEFLALAKADGNQIEKIRYYYPYQGLTAEIDVFLGKLEGLVLIDFEFNTTEEAHNFNIPDFCLADVTPEDIIAGGVLSHQTMESLGEFFKKYNYQELK